MTQFFEKLFRYVTSYVEEFDWKNAPLSSIQWPFIVVPTYLLLVYTLQAHVQNRKDSVLFRYSVQKETKSAKPDNGSYNVKALFAQHNLNLSLLSLVMFVFTALEVRKRVMEDGWDWIACETQTSSRGPLWFWSYIYYLSKYYELLDTVFLALKGKVEGWGGLNVYHHAVVVFMAWWWLEYQQTLQFVGLLFNTFVHIIMYFYFFMAEVGHRPPWKKLVTAIQIIQFTVSLLLFCYTMSLISTGRVCRGEYCLYVNLVFNVTLLAEFVTIFRKPAGNRESRGTDTILIPEKPTGASASSAAAPAAAAPIAAAAALAPKPESKKKK